MSFRSTLLCLGPLFLAVLAPLVSAQQPTSAPAAKDPRAADLEELVRRFQSTTDKFYDALSAAEGDEAQIEELFKADPRPAFAKEFRVLAEKAQGTETAATALMWVVRIGVWTRRQPAVEGEVTPAHEALETLLRDHSDSLALAQFAGELEQADYALGDSTCQSALRRILEKSPHANVRAAAQYSLASLLMRGEASERKAEGRKLLLDLVENAKGEIAQYAELAEHTLFELEHLQVGMVAPDFEAVDQNGVAWKLSDYRGKVVVVDFWGFW